MLPSEYEYAEDEVEVQRLFRHAFLKDFDSVKALAVLLKKLGTWSSDPDLGPGKAHLRAFGMQILEELGINHEANEMAVVIALTQIPPVEAVLNSQRSDE